MRHLIVTALAALLIAPAALLAEDKAAEKPVTVPFELTKSRHMVVTVKLNGKGPYRLIFDTGAPIMLINNRIAKDSGVVDAKTKQPPFALFGALGTFTINSMEMGDLKADSVGTVVMDHPTVDAISRAFGQIDGIVGHPFFARYKMTVDYQAKEMTFEPSAYKPRDVVQAMMGMMMGGKKGAGPRVAAPAGQWGLEVAKKDGDDEAGVTVDKVLDGSAAAAGGLKAGDRVLTLDGRWTDTVADAYLAASLIKPGKAVPVVVQRQGKEVKLTVTPKTGL
jgi:hypothetical protein